MAAWATGVLAAATLDADEAGVTFATFVPVPRRGLETDTVVRGCWVSGR